MIIENKVTVDASVKRARNLENIQTKQVVQFVIDSPNLLLNKSQRNG